MVVVKKYPTAIIKQLGTYWTNPTYVLGSTEGDCAVSTRVGARNTLHSLQLGSFGFDIPSGSTLNRVTLGFRGSHNQVYGCATYDGAAWADFYIPSVNSDLMVDRPCLTGATCANSTSKALDLVQYMLDALTPEKLNTETDWEIWVFGTCTLVIGNSFYFDWVYVEVDYTPPVVGVPYGDGLVWIVQACIYILLSLHKIIKHLLRG